MRFCGSLDDENRVAEHKKDRSNDHREPSFKVCRMPSVNTGRYAKSAQKEGRRSKDWPLRLLASRKDLVRMDRLCLLYASDNLKHVRKAHEPLRGARRRHVATDKCHGPGCG